MNPDEISPSITADVVEETPIQELESLDTFDPEPENEKLAMTVSDCENLYGVVMETAHAVVGTRKEGSTHRELPVARRKAQGAMLHSICEKYNIVIPTEFEIIIFGGALVADWQYMSVAEEKNEQSNSEIKLED